MEEEDGLTVVVEGVVGDADVAGDAGSVGLDRDGGLEAGGSGGSRLRWKELESMVTLVSCEPKKELSV